MFRAIAVLLKAKPGTRLHGNALDLKAVRGIHRPLPPPGAVDRRMEKVLGPTLAFKVFDKRSHILGIVAVGNQYYIVGNDNDGVADTQNGGHAAIRPNVRILNVLCYDIAISYVVIVIFLSDIP